MTERRPPPTKITVQPGESPFMAAARELARNPDSPASLQIMSAVGRSMGPRVKAADQVRQALEEQLEEDGPRQRAAVDAAVAAWERICGATMDADLLASLREDAARALQERGRRPPPLKSIVLDLPATTDTGYQLGVHLHGLEGTWHRLWAMACLSYSFARNPSLDEGVLAVRAQFEALLGRRLSDDEWMALSAHAQAHAASANLGPV